jgi:Transposase, Mutator family
MRRSPKVAEVLPLLYLHGLSSGDFAPALREFFGVEAGLSPTTIVRLTEKWQKEREEFMERDLSERDYVYVWVDGIHTKVRLGQDDKLCCLVMIGARIDGKKELVALQEGYRESCESWAELFLGGPEEARDACSGFGGRRWGIRVLEGAKGHLPRDSPPARLGAQNCKRARRAAEERA